MRLSLFRIAVALATLSIPASTMAGQNELAEPADPTPVLLERMTTVEIREAIDSGRTTILIPNASTEATGPAIALGKHLVRASYVSEHIARGLGNALVAPVMPFAPTTDESRFPGTINLSVEAFSRVNEEIAESMVRTGFKYIVFMGDHDANQLPLHELAGRLDEQYRAEGVRVFFSSGSYSRTNQQIDEYLNSNGYPPSRHGGVSDTSLTWAANAEYVHPDRLVVGAPVPPAGSPLSLGEIGIEGDPRRASLELGRMFLDWKVENGVAEIKELIENSR